MPFCSYYLLAPLLLISISANAASPATMKFDFAPGELTSLCLQAIEKDKARTSELLKIPEGERTIENTLLAREEIENELQMVLNPLEFMRQVHPDETVRAEATKCAQTEEELGLAQGSNRELFHLIEHVSARNPEEARLLKITIRDFKNNGLNLSDENLAKLNVLKKKLADLSLEFSGNINNDNSTVEFTEAEAGGIPPSFLKGLARSDKGSYVVSTKETDYVTVEKNASSSALRKRLALAFANRAAPANMKILDQMLSVRHQIARLLGFDSWADVRLANRMAKSKATVMNFLEDLKPKLQAQARKDLAKLVSLKAAMEPMLAGEPKLEYWDYFYYPYQLEKKEYSVDHALISEYFPTQSVLQGVFDIYGKMLGVNIRAVEGAKTWAEGVKAYEVRDSAGGEALGFFYADLFPRKGKYSHAAIHPIFNGYRMPDGTYSKPMAAIVAGFSPARGDRPSLLRHDEVITLFHEFGHLMHCLLTKAPYSGLSGTMVARDFVEAPSQMLENFLWSEKVIEQVSSHYLRPQEKMPKEMIRKLIATKELERGTPKGIFYARQLALGLFDMMIHSQAPPKDVQGLYNQIYFDLTGIEALPGNSLPASFGHLVGYDSGYYGYLWSKVYAEDMFTQFPESDPVDPIVGARYRKIILERGNMEEPLDLVRQFVGREPNAKAFLERIGLKP